MGLFRISPSQYQGEIKAKLSFGFAVLCMYCSALIYALWQWRR